MADQTVSKYLSIGTTFDPCYLSLDSNFKALKFRPTIKKTFPIGRNAIYFDVGQKLHKCLLNDSDNDS